MPTFEFRYEHNDGKTGGATMITAMSKERAMDKFLARVGRGVKITKFTVVKE